MKRLLTYGLLLLTILASHFVVSACQDDLPETTEVMMTFTTRAVTQGAASTAPDKERMKDLHVIMLRSDGTIVGNHTEPNITASSVTFTFSTPIKTTGEDFTFLAIANENNIGKTLVNDNLKIGDELYTDDIENLTMDANLITIDALPQTKLWTVHVPQTQNHKVNQTLDFVGSKISVVFNNMTKEPQSLSNIHITGITPNTQGYLFKQDGTDYIDSKLTDNGNAVSTISFGDLTLAAPTTGVDDETIYASDSVAYYTYPLAEGNFNSPMLYATWGDETEPRTLDLSDITSLKRNEHLRIEITLTPAGDITVNYTIAAWEETPTNIGDTAPTTPDNGYHVDDWGASNDIEIGGGGGKDWNLGGITIKGEEVKTDWEDTYGIDAGLNDVIQGITLPNEKTFRDLQGYIILIEFVCYEDNGKNANKDLTFDVLFLTDYDRVFSERNINEDGTQADPFAWNDKQEAKDESEPPYVRYVELTEDVVDFIYDYNSSKQTIFNIKVVDAATGKQEGLQIALKQFKLIKPTSVANL